MSKMEWLRQAGRDVARLTDRYLSPFVGRLRRQLRRLPRQYQIGGTVLMAILIITGVFLALHRTPPLTPRQKVNLTYSKALSSLANGADRLPPKYWPAKSLAADLSDYDDLLYQMQGDCNGLKSNYKTMLKWQLPQKTKSSMGQVDRLCGDLLGVLKYSQDVYHAAHNYLFQDMSTWPDASQHYDYLSRLNATHQAAATTKSSLQNVYSGATNDPALQELVATADSTLILADKAQAALDAGDLTLANDLGQQITKKLGEDTTEFMSARTYFWNNTIQVGKLRLSIATQLAAFSPPQPTKH